MVEAAGYTASAQHLNHSLSLTLSPFLAPTRCVCVITPPQHDNGTVVPGCVGGGSVRLCAVRLRRFRSSVLARTQIVADCSALVAVSGARASLCFACYVAFVFLLPAAFMSRACERARARARTYTHANRRERTNRASAHSSRVLASSSLRSAKHDRTHAPSHT